MPGDKNDAEVRCYTGDKKRVRRVVTGDSVLTVNAVVTGNRRLVRRVRAVTGDSVVTVDAVFTGDRKRVFRLFMVDVMVMGHAVFTGDAMLTGTGEHGCCCGHM